MAQGSLGNLATLKYESSAEDSKLTMKIKFSL